MALENLISQNEIKTEVADANSSSTVILPEDKFEYEQDVQNTVGNISMEVYKDLPHIGYDIDGNKIMKPIEDNEIDDFLNKIDDPNYWRTVKHKMTGRKIVLTDEDVELIQKIQGGRYPSKEDQFKPFEDFFSYEVMKHPVTNQPEHKRSFIPSKIEKEKVAKMVYAIKMGWIKPRAKKEDKSEFYLMWDNEKLEDSKRLQHYIPAPKRQLPGHEESYNPPPEYLFTKEEEEKWKEQEPEERKLSFIPQKFPSLRQVPAYSQLIKESFERCLDLYLCPRKRKMKVNVDPNDLLPQIPKPKDLRPFPCVPAIVYRGHSNIVICITVDPSGQFLASGSEDNTLRIWEVITGRCFRILNFEAAIKCVAWCPVEDFSLLLAVVADKVYIINPEVGDKSLIDITNKMFKHIPENTLSQDTKVAQWALATKEQKKSLIRVVISHSREIKQVVWQAKGDYFAAVVPTSVKKAVIFHQISKFRSQILFQKLKGQIQCVAFHPFRPLFFVATEKHVLIYNLIQKCKINKLQTNCDWISSMAIHPQGDNLIIGSYDHKFAWFDLDLSSKPYQTLSSHKKAIRQVAFHKKYPLFASASDDGTIIIGHGMVYNDLLRNPLIVPVKILKGHEINDEHRILDCCFHPYRPWIFSCSTDSTIRLFSE